VESKTPLQKNVKRNRNNFFNFNREDGGSMNNLINSIAVNTDGLTRGKLEAIISKLKVGDEATVAVKIKIGKEGANVYRHGAKLSCNIAEKITDETEMILFNSEPDMLDKKSLDDAYDSKGGTGVSFDNAPLNKNPGIKPKKGLVKAGEFIQSAMTKQEDGK
jgi:hypothetical protein